MEGRDRVGGRSSTTTIAGVPVDLGGTFVGPTQDAVVELARRVGLRDGADLPPRQEPDPVARPGPRVPQHHSPAVDARAVRRLPDPVAIREDLPTGLRRRTVDRHQRREPRRTVAGCVVALAARQCVDPRSDGDHGKGDLGLRARPGVDAARRALRQGRGRNRADARRRRRRAAGPLPRRYPADRAAAGRRAG